VFSEEYLKAESLFHALIHDEWVGKSPDFKRTQNGIPNPKAAEIKSGRTLILSDTAYI
jgi:hypothetical protein